LPYLKITSPWPLRAIEYAGSEGRNGGGHLAISVGVALERMRGLACVCLQERQESYLAALALLIRQQRLVCRPARTRTGCLIGLSGNGVGDTPA